MMKFISKSRIILGLLGVLLSGYAYGNIFTSRADLTWSLDGGSTRCNCTPGNADVLIIKHVMRVNLGNFSGSITVEAGGVLSVPTPVSFLAESIIDIQLGGSMNLAAPLRNSSGSFRIDGLVILDAPFVNLADITLSGSGKIVCNAQFVNQLSGGINGDATKGCVGGFISLPVVLLNFNARLKGKQVVLSIQTEGESKSSTHTFIERSTDAQTFEVIARFEEKKGVDKLHTYNVIDNNPPAGTVYYRICRRNKYSISHYSSIVSVKVNAELLQVYPTLCNGRELYVKGLTTKSYQMYMYDQKGVLVVQKKVKNEGNILANKTLKPGLYFIRVFPGSFKQRIVVYSF